MQTLLDIQGTPIPAQIRQSRSGKLTLKFKRGQEGLLIDSPDGTLSPVVKKFIEQKSRWILKHFNKQEQVSDQRADFLSRLDNEVLYMGKWYPLEVVTDKRRFVQVKPDRIILHLRPADQNPDLANYRILYAALRALAKNYLNDKVKHWSAITDLAVKQVRVKDHRSKWGSCSTLRNVNLNWHLILLPPALIDYVIVHELMHLHEMNHSSRFWNWVGKYYPDYKKADKELNNHSWLIGILSEVA